MSEDIKDSLHILRTRVPLINQVTDEANETVRSVEAILEQAGVGIEESVPTNYTEADVPFSSASLAYTKIGGKFRIVVEWYINPMTKADGRIAWTECSREDKLATIRALPNLLRKLTDRMAKQITYAEEAKAAITDVRNALGLSSSTDSNSQIALHPQGGIRTLHVREMTTHAPAPRKAPDRTAHQPKS